CDPDLALKKVDCLPQILNWNYLQAVHQRRLRRIALRHQETNLAIGFRAKRDSQSSFNRPNCAVQCELTNDCKVVELVGFNLLARSQHPDGNGQVEVPTL